MVAVREVRIQLARIVEDVAEHGARYVVSSHGKARCAIVSLDDLAQLQAAAARPPKPTRKARRVPRD